ncbi:MAG: IclR family transcriptional regulator, partial [Alphaproteobacteria bacterium]|nr:IclR family transcriptional regulator [Alphaproteobacteria bacterium]
MAAAAARGVYNKPAPSRLALTTRKRAAYRSPMRKTSFAHGKRDLSGLGHGLDALEWLAGQRGGAPLGDIARAVKMSKPGAHRVLATLRRRGYVEHAAGGVYQLGLKTWELGRAVPMTGLVPVATPLMERLTRQIGEGAILGVLDGFEVVYVQLINGPNPIRVHAEIGARIAAHCTSTGLALLAHLPPARLAELLPAALPATTAHTITTPDGLRRELARIRARGHAVNLGGWRPEVGGVAAPIFGADGVAFAALCVAAPRFRMNRDWLRRVPPAVTVAAKHITEAL